MHKRTSLRMIIDTRHTYRDLDLAESGTRELAGEWVVGTEVWKRLKAERRARQDLERKRRRKQATSLDRTSLNQLNGGSSAWRDSPDVDTDPESVGTARKGGAVGERVIYYIHGGAYYVGNAATHRMVTIGVSKACNARVFGMSPP